MGKTQVLSSLLDPKIESWSPLFQSESNGITTHPSLQYKQHEGFEAFRDMLVYIGLNSVVNQCIDILFYLRETRVNILDTDRITGTLENCAGIF